MKPRFHFRFRFKLFLGFLAMVIIVLICTLLYNYSEFIRTFTGLPGPTVLRFFQGQGEFQPHGPRFLVYSRSNSNNSAVADGHFLPGAAEYSKLNHSDKLILFWTPKYGDYSLKSWGMTETTLASCPIKCDFSLDHSMQLSADAIVFHPRTDMSTGNIPSKRRPDQVYVFAYGEPPHKTHLNLRHYNNFFNWTLTYRREAEVYDPYGVFTPRSKPLESIPEKYTRPKTGPGTIAWLVSSCRTVSKREELAKELSNYISVHIYGACGDPCPGNVCMEWLATRYKFYLAFENSLCLDYVTEKFFNPLKYGMVPIYYGGHALEVEHAPSHSYINVQNYSSISKLVDYLLYLDQDETEYRRYFEWTKYYTVEYPKPWCDLCQKLHAPDTPRRTYSDLHTWWKEQDERGNPICQENVTFVVRFNALWDYLYN